MRMIQLTDFFDKKSPVIVTVDSVIRIKEYEKEFMDKEECEIEVGVIFKSKVKSHRYVNPHTRTGTVITQSNGDEVFVTESMDQVVELLLNTVLQVRN